MKISESVMSDVDLLARESKSFSEFVKKFRGGYGGRLAKIDDAKLMAWLKDVWSNSQKVLHEASITLNKNQKFVVSHIIDRKGFALQFIPDSATLKTYSKNELVTAILTRLKTSVPMLADSIYFDINNPAAGLIFYINGRTYADFVTAAMNK